jgi:hypothetical protein
MQIYFKCSIRCKYTDVYYSFEYITLLAKSCKSGELETKFIILCYCLYLHSNRNIADPVKLREVWRGAELSLVVKTTYTRPCLTRNSKPRDSKMNSFVRVRL